MDAVHHAPESQNIDVFPTVLASAGAKPEPAWKVDGADMLAVWEGEAKVPPRTLYWEWRAEGHKTSSRRCAAT
jgi:arylsulfatase A-like enzyme